MSASSRRGVAARSCCPDDDRALPLRLTKFWRFTASCPHRLPHLFPAMQYAVVHRRSCRSEFEFHLVVAFLRLPLRRSQPHRSRAPSAVTHSRPALADYADIDIALLKIGCRSASFRDRRPPRERISTRPRYVTSFWRQVLMHASGRAIICIHPRTLGALVKHHPAFRGSSSPTRRSRTDVIACVVT